MYTVSCLKHILVCLTPRRHKTCTWAVSHWNPESAPMASMVRWNSAVNLIVNIIPEGYDSSSLNKLNWFLGSLSLKEWKGPDDTLHWSFSPTLVNWIRSQMDPTNSRVGRSTEMGWHNQDQEQETHSSQQKCVKQNTVKENSTKEGKTEKQLHNNCKKTLSSRGVHNSTLITHSTAAR